MKIWENLCISYSANVSGYQILFDMVIAYWKRWIRPNGLQFLLFESLLPTGKTQTNEQNIKFRVAESHTTHVFEEMNMLHFLHTLPNILFASTLNYGVAMAGDIRIRCQNLRQVLSTSSNTTAFSSPPKNVKIRWGEHEWNKDIVGQSALSSRNTTCSLQLDLL